MKLSKGLCQFILRYIKLGLSTHNRNQNLKFRNLQISDLFFFLFQFSEFNIILLLKLRIPAVSTCQKVPSLFNLSSRVLYDLVEFSVFFVHRIVIVHPAVLLCISFQPWLSYANFLHWNTFVSLGMECTQVWYGTEAH